MIMSHELKRAEGQFRGGSVSWWRWRTVVRDRSGKPLSLARTAYRKFDLTLSAISPVATMSIAEGVLGDTGTRHIVPTRSTIIRVRAFVT